MRAGSRRWPCRRSPPSRPASSSPAPRASSRRRSPVHAIRAAIDEALKCKATGEAKTILFNLTGHGHFDMASFDKYFSGQLEDFDYPAEAIAESLKHLPKVG